MHICKFLLNFFVYLKKKQYLCTQKTITTHTTMRKLFMILAAVLMAAMVNAGTPEVYIPAEELPHLLSIMPPPPAFNSPEFASDEVRYNWGKEQRQDSARLAMAIADAEWNDLEIVLSRWQEAFGMPISEATTPHIYALLVNSITTVDPMRIEPKAFYQRQRPFERYDDTMPSHEESFLRGEGSYPSGHSLRGWLIGLVLAQVAPERAEAILARSWDYCNSRAMSITHVLPPAWVSVRYREVSVSATKCSKPSANINPSAQSNADS